MNPHVEVARAKSHGLGRLDFAEVRLDYLDDGVRMPVRLVVDLRLPINRNIRTRIDTSNWVLGRWDLDGGPVLVVNLIGCEGRDVGGLEAWRWGRLLHGGVLFLIYVYNTGL